MISAHDFFDGGRTSSAIIERDQFDFGKLGRNRGFDAERVSRTTPAPSALLISGKTCP